MPRPRTIEIRNTALEQRIEQTRQTYGKIAAKINEVCAENGSTTRCNPGSISHWLTGRTPQPETIPAVVETFRRLLGEPFLRAADLGWHLPDTAPDDPGGSHLWEADPMTWLDHLGRRDMTNPHRRDMLFSLAAATIPALTTAPHRAAAGTAGTAAPAAPAGRAGLADVARIREMTATFSELDDRFGGGHARVSVAAYLTGQVVPLLRGASARSHPTLYVAAAEMAYLAGFMASDARQYGLGQRYYVQALRLADDAADPAMRAVVLRAMAVQSLEVGHPRHARDLADAAARSLPRRSPPRLDAWITAMRAETAARTGDRRQALEFLRLAERGLNQAESTNAPEAGRGITRVALQHQTGLTLTATGDLAAAQANLADSLAGREPQQRRSRALIGARLALLQAQHQQHGAAADTIDLIAPDLAIVQSARVDRELVTLRSAWSSARSEAGVRGADKTLARTLRRRAPQQPPAKSI